MNRRLLLAAELYDYSYANYADHLGIGNIRFDKLMRDDVDTLGPAEQERWTRPRLGQTLDIPEEEVADWVAC